jgi:glutathione S-transferase
MLKLVVLPAAFGVRNISPFCLKTEMLLTDLGLPFEMTELADPRKAPKGKLPFLYDGDTCIADSELIVEYLDEKTGGRVYAGMTPQQKAHGLALTRLAEEHLYWTGVASRWLDDDWWPNVVKGFFHIIPAPFRALGAGLARREVRKTYHLQGLGRHSLEDQKGFAERDLQALEDAIPDTGFLGGDVPRIPDFAVASLLAGMMDNQPPTWFTGLAKRHEKLVDYAERVQSSIGVYGRYTDD